MVGSGSRLGFYWVTPGFLPSDVLGLGKRSCSGVNHKRRVREASDSICLDQHHSMEGYMGGLIRGAANYV